MTAASGIPTKYQLYWAQNAGGAFVRTPPFSSSGTPGAASFNDGFVPTNMTLGGIPPFGQDMNGALRLETQWSQWLQMGGPVPYDGTFQTQIGGYPAGSIISSATTLGLFWFSATDNNVTNPDAAGAGWTSDQPGVFPQTGAQLQFTSAALLALVPFRGGYLWINGLNYPVTGTLTFASSGLVANTLYYLYAKVTGGVIATDTPSTTGYTVGANGMPVKSGDATRTLVGIAHTQVGSAQWISQDGFLWVRSYFGRQLQRTRTSFTAQRSVSSASFAEINNEIQNNVLVWSGEQVRFSTTGTVTVAAANRTAATQISFDGGATELESSVVSGTTIGGEGGLTMNASISGIKTGLAEGSHFCTLFGASSAGTATWDASNSVSAAATTITLSVGN
jgi:hypothetical protein